MLSQGIIKISRCQAFPSNHHTQGWECRERIDASLEVGLIVITMPQAIALLKRKILNEAEKAWARGGVISGTGPRHPTPSLGVGAVKIAGPGRSRKHGIHVGSANI